MSRFTGVVFMFIFLCAGFTAWGQASSQSAGPRVIVENVYEDIDIQTARKIMKLSKNYVLIDVRTPEEIAGGKIGNALEIDFRNEDFKNKVDKLDRNLQYIVYCHAGGRSAAAAGIMREMGFKQVYNLTEGYRAWPQNQSGAQR